MTARSTLANMGLDMARTLAAVLSGVVALPKAFDNATAEPATMLASVILKRAPDSEAMLEYWDLTDCLVAGKKAIRDAGEKYLPKFADEQKTDYEVRLSHTKFTNVYRDIIESLASKPFEEEVSIVEGSGNDAVKKFAEDVDGSGNNLTAFASAVFFNGINSAIDWIFVDYPPEKETANVRTVADLEQSGIRPFWSHVRGRNVLQATTQVIGGKETLVYIRILEPGEPDHVRIFERDPATGFVYWSLYKKTEKAVGTDTIFVKVDGGQVSINIIPLVPFATGRRDGRTFCYRPIMRDAADLQIELYQEESGLKYARVLAAFPMLAGNGVKPQTDKAGNPLPIAIGPGRVLYAPPGPDGTIPTWSFIEIAATSLTFLASNIEKTIQNLRELGRQPLTAQSGNLTVITTAVAAGKAGSAVKAWALELKNALEKAFIITALWMNDKTTKTEINVYTEFDDFADGGKDQDTLNTARGARDISQRTYWKELQRRKVLSPEFDADEEEKALLDETPADDPNLNDGNPEIDPLTGKPIVKPKPQPKQQPGA